MRASAAFALLHTALAAPALADLPPMPNPPNNQVTEPKRVLGKILFWDEQLSSSNTISCGTCHIPSRGGSDTRRQRVPGLDNLFNTPDDAFGSPGVIRADANRNFIPDADFNFGIQATPRNSMTFMMAGYAPVNFWDGRARGAFIDPLTGQVVNQLGASLEIQALGPVTSDVEMAHEGRTWSDAIAKLGRVRPFALATNVPPDVQNVLTPQTTYAALFQAAFGTPQITATRVAQALATYQRTLIPDQTPWDRFQAGEQNALTPGQIAGMNTFNGPARCNLCHGGNQFTGNGFRNIGLRPIAEDSGQQAITGNPADAGKFKVPSLRNVGLRNMFMHNGQFTTLTQVIQFYARAPGAAPQFPANQDPIMSQIAVPPQAAPALQDFIANALTDPCAAAGMFPFDRPTLFSERAADRPVALPGGNPGAGGITPQVIIGDPPMLGNADFRLGVMNARAGASADVIMSRIPPQGGALNDGRVFDLPALSGSGTAGGFGTFHWAIPAGADLAGQTWFFQFRILDPAAAGGIARSNIAQVTFFCPSQGCPPACTADFNLDGTLDPDDLGDFINTYFGPPTFLADFNKDGHADPDDLGDFINAFFAGCEGA
ncbi:MAG: cytochrome c peroxidase [Phycisphaerales bacterium]